MILAGLDFETANRMEGSICSVGCALLEDGEVRDRKEWLVRPHKGYGFMLPEFTQIHGLRWRDVCNCPEFNDVWPEALELLRAADYVVCHNARFDLGQLRAAIGLYNLPHVSFQYADSCTISRKLLPQLENHRLDTVADFFGFQFHHHDSMEDAEACAKIVAKTGIPDGYARNFYC